MECKEEYRIILPESLGGRSIYQKVIPTVCTLKNMLKEIDQHEGRDIYLSDWAKRSYKAYGIEKFKKEILHADAEERKRLIRKKILETKPEALSPHVVDIYLVGYVSEKTDHSRSEFLNYIMKKGVTDKENSANAIWQVGKGDGFFLGILNKDGAIKDWNFIVEWIHNLNK